VLTGGDAIATARAQKTRTRRALNAIEIAVQRGSTLTRQLLSFSRRQTHEARTIDL
jgi:two-component system, NtrC family, sensor kinase